MTYYSRVDGVEGLLFLRKKLAARKALAASMCNFVLLRHVHGPKGGRCCRLSARSGGCSADGVASESLRQPHR